MINRRTFIQSAAVSSTSVLGWNSLSALAGLAGTHRRFTMDLRCGSIGVSADFEQAVILARRYGFESVNMDSGELLKRSEAQRRELPAWLKERGLIWGAAGLPVEFRRDEERFQNDLKSLPSHAKAMQEAGITRVGTWLSPYHESLNYVANLRQHARRLRECCKILGDHGQRFGMEYVGPKTLWASSRHSFIHSMAETKDLIAEIGLRNVGFVLDSWHWYTAHETVEDLRTLRNEDIVACDLNDAPAGIEIDQQIDNRRELPAATGVINLAAFLGTLVEIGYDGPVRAEPFNAPLNALDDEPAVAAVGAAMKKAFALVPARESN